MIVFACSHCGRMRNVPDDRAGKDAACPHCGRVTPIPQPATTAPATALEPATQGVAGGQSGVNAFPTIAIPGYEILGELGRGGMGVIYKARQLQPRRIVALKMILAGEHAGADALARFRREADAVAKLSHPNVVPIHEVGEHQGRPYLTLEFMEGGNLAQYLRGQPLDYRAAAELVRTLARAVQFAHRRGILHRDLKPANILLAGDGTPKIGDFGLAKQLDGTASMNPIAAARTQSGAIMGTPSYMAPEQAGGKSKDIGPAADVYALGAILYECLTGRPPFQAETTLDTLLKVAGEEPTPPRQLRSDCPHNLEIICLKCLQKQPRKRYASAGALADDLGKWLDGEPIAARPPGQLERLGRWLRRRKEYLYLAGGIAAVLCLLPFVWFFVPQSEPGSDIPKMGRASNNGIEPSNSLESSRQRLELASQRIRAMGNLRLFGLALQNVSDANKGLPPATLTHPRTGKPLLSWRVAILPFIEEQNLYQQFKRDEPWDSEHNKRLLARMPKLFALEGFKTAEPNTTYFQVLVGPGTAFEPTRKPHSVFGFAGQRLPADFSDGTANTVLIVEAAEAVPWTKPADLIYDPGGPLPALGGHFADGFLAVMADGLPHVVKKSVSEQSLRNAITRNDGEVLGNDW